MHFTEEKTAEEGTFINDRERHLETNDLQRRTTGKVENLIRPTPSSKLKSSRDKTAFPIS
jgi:hypothetical protein